MNFAETAEVIAAIQIYDNRRADEATVKAWHKIIGRFSKADCLDGVVEHYTNSTDWLMPAHIKRFVAKRRARRIELAGHPALNYEDEYDVDDNIRSDAKDRHAELVDGIANGTISPEQYQHYRVHKIMLESLLAQARPLT